MKKIILVSLILMLSLVIIPATHAHCPLCTAAVGTAAISAKYYGLDESAIGLLIGAFGVSTGLWIGLRIKKQYFTFQLPVIVLLSYILTIMPLMYVSSEAIYLPILWFGAAGSFLNKVYWVNKLFFGSIVGFFITLISYFLHIHLKKLNGKVLFPFQGIALTLLLLIVASSGLIFIFK
ncbi:MAG: hypothetical protein AABX33_05130 [Nanoarchaeota archaeon]